MDLEGKQKTPNSLTEEVLKAIVWTLSSSFHWKMTAGETEIVELTFLMELLNLSKSLEK